MLVAWLGLVLALIGTARSFPPRPRIFGISEIAVSESGKHKAAVCLNGFQLFRGDRYVGQVDIGIVDSLGFMDEDTLAVVSIRGELPCGVHFYSLAQGKFVRHLPLDPGNDTRAFLLEKNILVRQIDSNRVGRFDLYEADAREDSKPVASYPSPPTNFSFDATNDGRYLAFYFDGQALPASFDNWRPLGVAADFDLQLNKSLGLLKMPIAAAFSPDGSMVITCMNSITAYKWPSGETLWSIPCERCGSVRFSNDGDKFAVLTGKDYSDDDRKVQVFDAHSGQQLAEMIVTNRAGVGFAFSVDGDSVWTAAQDQQGGLVQREIASNSIVNRAGSVGRGRNVAYFVVLFVLWSAIFCKTLPSRLNLPGRLAYQKNVGVLYFPLALFGVMQLVYGCWEVLESYSGALISINLIHVVMGTGLVVLGLHRTFISKRSESPSHKDLLREIAARRPVPPG